MYVLKEKTIARTSNLISELATFYDEGYIQGEPKLLKSGKEATVYCCRTDSLIDADWVAAKIYRPLNSRCFKNDAVYREGRVITDSRARRAVQNSSRKGRGMAFGMWIGHEFETLSTLHSHGADVPRPISLASSAMLMEYFGDEWTPAPRLADIEIDAKEASDLYRQILRNVEIGLSCHLVHGDLSEYNILYWKGEARIIDYPQAVDTLRNRNAYDLLERDIQRVTAYFAAYGLNSADPYRISRSLWAKYGK